MKSDERSRVKHNYSSNPIWMLGVEYKFTGKIKDLLIECSRFLILCIIGSSQFCKYVCLLEDGGTINLPKPDRGEHARGGRASSLLNFIMFGSSEEDEDYNDVPSIHERHHSDDLIRTHNFGNQNVIKRLRSFSFSYKSSDQKTPTPESSPPKNENRIMLKSRIRPLSSSKKQELSDSLNYESTSNLQKDVVSTSVSRTNNSNQSQNARRFSMSPSFLRSFSIGSNSSSNHQENSSPNSQVQGNLSPKSKKHRRKTFGARFSGREKNKYSSSLPIPQLYPHLETETDYESKFSHDSGLKRTSFEDIDVSRKNREVICPEDLCFSSEEESNSSETISKPGELDVEALSGDNISVETVTRESMKSSDYLGVYTSKNNNDLPKDIDISKDVSNNLQNDRSMISIQTDMWGSQKTETGSVRSSGSVRSLPPTPTSLYRPDSLGPLTNDQQKLLDFLLDFQSRIFCCYRKEFPPIEPAFHTTDTGWGCMHRTGQSLLAQGFLWVLLGRDWRLHNLQTESDILIYRKILRWFMDGPESEQYYSIHNIARVGVSLDKKIGDWFGPATVAHALKRLSMAHKECPLVIYVPTDNTIYRSEVVNAAMESCDAIPDQKPWKPVLILLSIRLGTDKLNPSYSDNLKLLFKFPQFLGISGGRPGRSLYFVAFQDDELLYLDPHFVRPAINLNKITEFPIEDYHSTIVRTMDISEMDPSMLLGFLCQSSQDFDQLCGRVEREMNSQYPLFTILNACPIPGSWSRKKSLSDVSISDRSVSDMSPSIIIETIDDVDEDVEDFKDITHEEDDGVISAKGDDEIIFEEQSDNSEVNMDLGPGLILSGPIILPNFTNLLISD
ncbi:6772_t:CDS:10 [Funneliformis mosseae]|uniref:Cysteine protease n=1 Tax=Funneliformis mosseae TaxID=27381 RepID=A0A9N9DTP2_FUNMO|nr:6772_t:CDS:10 [Funneliformis mosseae]